jgi:hypothetical protein
MIGNMNLILVGTTILDTTVGHVILGEGDYQSEKMLPIKELRLTLEEMNSRFGEGEILNIKLRSWECEPEKDWYYGVVYILCGEKIDQRFFKLENGYVTFLSRRRKLK